jgi:hypothetical protein
MRPSLPAPRGRERVRQGLRSQIWGRGRGRAAPARARGARSRRAGGLLGPSRPHAAGTPATAWFSPSWVQAVTWG